MYKDVEQSAATQRLSDQVSGKADLTAICEPIV
jgi:hypothetical protein